MDQRLITHLISAEEQRRGRAEGGRGTGEKEERKSKGKGEIWARGPI